MKIAIISDVHNNLTNLKKVLDYCAKEKIEKIICCGDLASLETLDFLNDNFALGSSTSKSKEEVELLKIYFVFGNMDNDHLKDHKFKDNQYKKTAIFRNFGTVESEGKKVAFTHFPNAAIELGHGGKYDFVFYGHTHQPWEQMIGKTKLLNPGNVAGEIYPATFAVWETENDKFELVRINELE
jgi:uncharacterized protein